MMKQIPYGLTDFGRIQKENYYYVDKTMFIEKIEMQPSYLFLIRPDASGKACCCPRWRPISKERRSCSRDWQWRNWKKTG